MIYNVDCVVCDGSLEIVTLQVKVTGFNDMDVEEEIQYRVPANFLPLTWTN